MKKVFLVLVGLLVIGWVVANCTALPAPFAQNTASAARMADTPYDFILEKRRLIDPSRSTDANGDYPGSEQRQFDLFVWRPNTQLSSAQPLVVYSHGFMSHGKGGSYIAEYLAGRGYTVVAPTYPLSNYFAPGGPRAEDVVNQPGDVRFIIDTLLAENNDESSEVFQTIDPSRIAAAGLSLGGLTTKLAAYHPRSADTRISLAVSIAGPSFMLGKRFFAERAIPFLMIATPQDAIVPYSINAADITERVPNSTLITMQGASHAGYSSTAKWMRWFGNPDSLGCRALEGKIEVEAESNLELYAQIGSQDDGVLRRDNDELCTMNPLPKTINPIHQHRLTALAVSAFMECHFAQQATKRESACQYLEQDFARENAEINVAR